MRGFASSFLTLARVASLSFFLPLLYDMPDHDTQLNAIQFHFAQLRCGLAWTSKIKIPSLWAFQFGLRSLLSRCAKQDIFQSALSTESSLP
jgi:hypothetical protein